jgi:hypothetical protein
MLVHRPLPAALIAGRLLDVGSRDGVVDSDAATSFGSESRKALRLLMMRGMPLNEIAFKQVSRMSSAAKTGSERSGTGEGSGVDDANWCRIARDSGEFIVTVAAV